MSTASQTRTPLSRLSAAWADVRYAQRRLVQHQRVARRTTH